MLTAAPVERRERRPVAMIGYALRSDGSSVEVMVLDLSYDGCGVDSPQPLTAGEPLKLSVLRRGAISCQVRWYADGRAGLVFDPDRKPGERQRRDRRSARIAIAAEVPLRRLGNISYRVRLFDASPDGCKVELVERPRTGEHVLVKLPQLEALDGLLVDQHRSTERRAETDFIPSSLSASVNSIRQQRLRPLASGVA